MFKVRDKHFRTKLPDFCRSAGLSDTVKTSGPGFGFQVLQLTKLTMHVPKTMDVLPLLQFYTYLLGRGLRGVKQDKPVLPELLHHVQAEMVASFVTHGAKKYAYSGITLACLSRNVCLPP
ncbi:hypothetical protein AK812_SmicGene44750 [Symbiodinium microadriaticum]|uniref:Uncharacterized protein n=1 Tax=Symbiodinium microadriaticum TaxID=2951 RepID=A0A1Q9BXP9_SYMMI|nr:hypothetical protein AK812_SmicGene44750 [Symbiodinium microadriaticum]